MRGALLYSAPEGPVEPILHFIGGEPVEPLSGGWFDNFEPATGERLGQVADGDGRDVERAVAAAEGAFPAWSRTPAAERSRLLLRLADLMEARLEPLARDESLDTGKPLALARSVDIPRAVSNLRFFATAILHDRTEAHLTDLEAINVTLRRPIGVAGCISPWNLPLYLLTWKVAPALATGNTVVAKPSEMTPITAWRLGELAREAGLPPGVLNIVHGRGAGAGAALAGHPRVPVITFTGGTATGAAIGKLAAPHFKRLTLELGGKNPTLVFADADQDAAIASALRAAFSNQGEICLCGSRLLVERPAFDAFVSRFVEGARRLKVGDPLVEGTDLGAMISKAHAERVAGYIRLAREEGGTILCGGGPPATIPERCRGGSFLEPTVITGLGPDCRVNREEIFGPVVTVQPFDTEEEALALANATPFGLSASLWTRDLGRAQRVADGLACGMVWVNCWMLRDLRVPFGGVRQSGVGREGGEAALHFFTEAKNVCFRVDAAAPVASAPQKGGKRG